jgi:hypothetical protein
VVVVDGASELYKVIEGVGSEKRLKSCEISHVELSFVLFPFRESAGDCDVATQLGSPVLES